MGRMFRIALALSACLASPQSFAAEARGLGLVASIDSASDARLSWLARVERSRREYEAFAALARSRLRAHRGDSAIDKTSPAANYMNDETLRSGDIIVTDSGLLVFLGAPHFGHGASEFKSINQWRGGERYQAMLMEIQRVSLSGER
ncbi:MAG: hypothetical protein WAK03_13740 [Methylocystis sp.]